MKIQAVVYLTLSLTRCAMCNCINIVNAIVTVIVKGVMKVICLLILPSFIKKIPFPFSKIKLIIEQLIIALEICNL